MPDLLARLARALRCRDCETALAVELVAAGLTPAAVDQVVKGALRLFSRANQRRPEPSPIEVELALGVLVVLEGGDRAAMPR